MSDGRGFSVFAKCWWDWTVGALHDKARHAAEEVEEDVIWLAHIGVWLAGKRLAVAGWNRVSWRFSCWSEMSV